MLIGVTKRVFGFLNMMANNGAKNVANWDLRGCVIIAWTCGIEGNFGLTE